MDFTICEWHDRYADDFLNLSLEWLKAYDLLEPVDFDLLEHPHEACLDQGGMIFFAAADGKNIGTVTIFPIADGIYEMAKLTVTESYRKLNIGKALVQKSIQFAKDRHAKQVILFTNSRLRTAIHLYKNFGFKEVPHTDSEYRLSDIKMCLHL